MPDLPVLVAHRGHAACFPENTLPALDSAVEAGARWVEVDVQLTADGVPVLMHDDDLERTCGERVSVFSLTAAALAGFSAGEPARFGGRHAHVRAPTLAEFGRWLAGRPGVQAFVEMKPESIERFGADTVAGACLDALGEATDRWVPLSYDDRVLDACRSRGLRRLGWVVRTFDAAVATRAAGLGASWLFRNHERMDAGPLPAGPWAWVPFEVDTPDLARSLVARGAKWLETMAVAEIARALGGAGPAEK